ncbi:MAG: hypothetical protein JRC92_04150 [Deltaproteobacteria bacterium]|nr:hypothetical protein [Deltaproteobacteria bacterium]
MENESSYGIRKTTGITIIIIALIGLIFFILSYALPEQMTTINKLIRELGIVLFAVCGISMIYEVFVAEKHFSKFADMLHKQIERGENIAAACMQLGIVEIFSRRDNYEDKYPLSEIANSVTPRSAFRVIGKTLFMIMGKPNYIKEAMKRGGTIELCMFNPEINIDTLRQVLGAETSDSMSALSVFRNHFMEWLRNERPPGRIEIRYHKIDLFDSYFGFVLNGTEFVAWDIEFTRDVATNKVIMFNPTIGLGKELKERYDKMWKMSEQKFIYKDRKIEVDELPQ